MNPEMQMQITQLKKLIAYQKQVRKERRETFEYWDRNNVALITQYEEELAKVTRDSK